MSRSAEQSSEQTIPRVGISTLRRKRGNIIGYATMLAKEIETAKQSEQPDIGHLRISLDQLNKSWDRFDDVQFELEELDDSESPRRYELHAKYTSIVAQATAIIERYSSNLSPHCNTTDSVATTVTAPATIKLPELRLPTFDGTIGNWISFYSKFTSAIDKNADLTPLQKLQYLQSTLTGKAAACIQALSSTGANYVHAIELLKKKFDCRRRILLSHCDAIARRPQISRDSPEALGDFVDAIRQNLCSLESMDIDTSSWDCIIVSIILSKVSGDLEWQWELSLKDKEMPSYEHLLEFLEKRAICAPAAPQKVASTPRQSNRDTINPSSNRHQA